jgi:hypothetical protein
MRFGISWHSNTRAAPQRVHAGTALASYVRFGAALVERSLPMTVTLLLGAGQSRSKTASEP